MSYVYFLRRADDTGPIKIGYSSCPEARRKQIGFDTKAEYAVLARAPGDLFAERNLHFKFAEHQEMPAWTGCRPYPVGGPTEWFAAVPELLSFIEQVRQLHIIPLAENERRERVFARRYLAGETLREIANDYGLTREGVRQILRKAGVPSLGRRSQHMRRKSSGAHAA